MYTYDYFGRNVEIGNSGSAGFFYAFEELLHEIKSYEIQSRHVPRLFLYMGCSRSPVNCFSRFQNRIITPGVELYGLKIKVSLNL